MYARDMSPDHAAHEPFAILILPRRWTSIRKGNKLRVSTWYDAPALVAVVSKTGYPIDPLQVTHLPSVCCGSCGG